MIAFSPVRQSPEILSMFLDCLDMELWAYDDNTDPESSALLKDSGCRILEPIDLPPSSYRRSDQTHHWDRSSVRRVAAIKNHAIDLFMETDHEHLFLIDSDVLIPPGLAAHLQDSPEPMLAAVYWTSWVPDSPLMPNVFPIDTRAVNDLRNPGHWPVGGTGAATMIHRDVFEAARFTEQPHLSTEGEDRWFCYLCHQAGIQPTVCTHFDLFHIYRDSDINAAARWIQ